MSNPLGVAIGFVLPSLFVEDSDKDKGNEESAREHIFMSLLVQAIIASVITVIIILFFRDKPPRPPSSSASMPREQFLPSLKAMLANKNALLLMVIFGFIQGVFNALGTVVGEISARYDFSPVSELVFLII